MLVGIPRLMGLHACAWTLSSTYHMCVLHECCKDLLSGNPFFNEHLLSTNSSLLPRQCGMSITSAQGADITACVDCMVNIHTDCLLAHGAGHPHPLDPPAMVAGVSR